MTDKQQFETIATELSNSNERNGLNLCESEVDLLAIDLCDAGYRKVPKNAVVLTQEEYNALLAKIERYKNKKAWAVTKEVCEEYRKETAKEILQEVRKVCGDYQWFKNLCKQYGVEVE